jgi:valyl-tRNA synthetase
MSKSLGNSPDPLDVIGEYGADALRFTIVSLAPPGEDVNYSAEKTDLGRHFANKIWNAARFVLLNLADLGDAAVPPVDEVPRETLSVADRWILSRLQATIEDVRRGFSTYRFNDSALALYQFIWHEYCDWYVEMSKIELAGTDARGRARVQSVLACTLERALRLLHPFMPFVTEEIWQALPLHRDGDSIMIAAYPRADAAARDLPAESSVQRLMEAVRSVRNIRSELGIAPTAALSIRVAAGDHAAEVAALEPYIETLARVERVEIIADHRRPTGEPSVVVDGLGEVFVPLRGVVDTGDVRKRLDRDHAKVAKELAGVQAKLGRRDFVERAPAAIVEKEQNRAESLRQRQTTLERHLAALQES